MHFHNFSLILPKKPLEVHGQKINDNTKNLNKRKKDRKNTKFYLFKKKIQ
jgi:hypothetical protein